MVFSKQKQLLFLLLFYSLPDLLMLLSRRVMTKEEYSLNTMQIRELIEALTLVVTYLPHLHYLKVFLLRFGEVDYLACKGCVEVNNSINSKYSSQEERKLVIENLSFGQNYITKLENPPSQALDVELGSKLFRLLCNLEIKSCGYVAKNAYLRCIPN